LPAPAGDDTVPSLSATKGNKINHTKDSGYHGTTDDEMEMADAHNDSGHATSDENAQLHGTDIMILDENPIPISQAQDQAAERGSTEGSYRPARENQTLRDIEVTDVHPQDSGQMFEEEEKEIDIEDIQLQIMKRLSVEAEERRSLHAEERRSLERELDMKDADLQAEEERSMQAEEIDVKDIQLQAMKRISLEAERRRMRQSSQEPQLAAPPIYDDDVDISDMSSDEMSPTKTLSRKNSLTFPTLPAREPLATKRSMGARVSRTSNLDTVKTGPSQSSYFGRITGGKSLGANLYADDGGVDVKRPELNRDESDGTGTMTRLHNKSSTQRLHERINALGKAQPARPTKSIPAVASTLQAAYPVLPPGIEQELSEAAACTLNTHKRMSLDDDDDWIQPPAKSVKLDSGARAGIVGTEEDQREQSERRPSIQRGKRDSAVDKISPSIEDTDRPAEAVEAVGTEVQPPLPAMASTTPVGSPTKNDPDGHGLLNSSKSKLQSLRQGARSLFNSSAGVSAQARIEAKTGISNVADAQQAKEMNYPALPMTKAPNVPLAPEPRKTCSSTEKEEQKRRSQERFEQLHTSGDDPKKSCEVMLPSRVQATGQSSRPTSRNGKATSAAEHALQQSLKPTRQSPRRAQPELTNEPSQPEQPPSSMPPPARPRTLLQKPRGVGRPAAVRTVKEVSAQPKVSIKMGSLAGRRPLTASSLSQAQHDPATSAANKVVAGKKVSNASQQTASSTASTMKSSASSVVSKPKALIAAERRKELEEKEKLRKLEQKREMERKKAAAQEEIRRQEEERQAEDRRKEREKQAAEEANRREQRQAIERKRQEQVRRELEQQAAEEKVTARAVRVTGHADTLQGRQHDREQRQRKTSLYRNDLGSQRPTTKGTLQDFPRPPTSHAAPGAGKAAVKRIFNPEQDDDIPRQAPARAGHNYKQHADGKRRKTGEEETFDAPEQHPTRPAMAPPIRYSNIKKDGSKPSIFGNNYPMAPPVASHHHAGPSQARPVMNPQFYGAQQAGSRGGNPMDMSKYTSAKIPFAEAPNPPPPQQPGYPAFKTPMQANRQQQVPQTQMSSPGFINGEFIHLDEIPTDSEDEDSEDERDRKESRPEWVNTPELNRALMGQESIDPDKVFGPIMMPDMEQMFKGGKSGNRFRNRTSSAIWDYDRVTEEEKKRDNEGRLRIQMQGGWSVDVAK